MRHFGRLKEELKIILVHLLQQNFCRSEFLGKDFTAPDFNRTKDIQYTGIKKISIPSNADYKWNAAVYVNDFVYGIPTGANTVLKLHPDTGEYQMLGQLSEENKKWTGGGVFGKFIYGFPRVSNKLLQINIENDEIKCLDIGCNYDREHHYGGVISDGKIYQPPRDTNHILVIDLTTFTTSKIYLSRLPIGFRYCGSILHPNGLIYFLPEKNERVMALNPKTGAIQYLGKPITAMTFSVALGANGNIFGFSAYTEGILYIDIWKRTANMIHTEIGCPGCYKNILYYNGKIYGLPGNGSFLWEYNIETDKVKKLYQEECDIEKPKVASGCIVGDRIVGLPAKADYFYIVEFKDKKLGGGTLVQSKSEFFIDFY